MKITSSRRSKLSSCRSVARRVLLCVVVLGVVCGSAKWADAQVALTVGNSSFETPNVTGTSPYFTAFPAITSPNTPDTWEEYNSNQTFLAVVAYGHYGNTPVGSQGSQFADIGGAVGGGIIQELSNYTTPTTGGVYVAGQTYTLTIGVALRSDSTPGTGRGLDLRFYYRTADGAAANILADTLIFAGSTGGPTTTALTDYSVSFTALPGQAEVGQPIGIWIPSVTAAGASATTGDFVVDNVRLASALAAVPEPSTWVMMFGGLGLLVCVQRLRRARSA